MYTYIVSVGIIILISSLVLRKKAYEKRFAIIAFAGIFSIILMSIMNVRSFDDVEWGNEVTKSHPLLICDLVMVDSTVGDTVGVFAIKSEDNFKFETEKGWRMKDSSSIVVHFIKDSLSVPRYVVTKDKVSKDYYNKWVPNWSITSKNRQRHVYLPDTEYYHDLVYPKKEKKDEETEE